MLIAVAPNRHAYGVEEGDDWRVPPGRPGNDRAIERDGRIRQTGIRSEYVVSHLSNALAETYKTDAHLVAYVLRDANGQPLAAQPRINKSNGGLDFVESLGFSIEIDCLFADLDNPGHVEWTDELLVHARAQDAQLLTAGVYYTAHGRRVVQPLTRPVRVPEAEGVLAAWLGELQRLGMHVDEGCQDWTRHFRLPHVKRRGVASTFKPIVSLAFMRPIDPPAPAPLLGVRSRSRGRTSGPAGDLDGTPLAEAFKLAGWLGHSLGKGKAAIRCPFAASHTIGRDFDSSSVLFGPTSTAPLGWIHCSHGHCSHHTQKEFLAALPPEARKLVPRPDRPAPPTRSLVSTDDAKVALEKAFRSAPDGLSVVVAGCGTGKTEAAIAVAGERAARPTRARTHSADGLPNTARPRSRSRRTSSRSR